jgi:lysozyme family protein
MSFDRAFAHTLAIEAGYSDNPADRGGKTNWGITERVARDNGYDGDMRALGVFDARRIYRAQYWDLNRLDDLDKIDEAVALELFDSGVNCGTGRAATWVQRALNVLNARATLYPDIKADGQIGPATVSAMARLYAARKDAGKALLRLLDSLQGAYYVEIAEGRVENEDFTYGWALARLGV